MVVDSGDADCDQLVQLAEKELQLQLYVDYYLKNFEESISIL